VNGLFFNTKRGRVKTTRYQAWLREVSATIKSQGLVHIPGDVSVEILIIKPDRRKRDLDNLAKSILDALVLNGVIDDDSLIQKILLAWHSDNLGGCHVQIRSHGMGAEEDREVEKRTDR
jgi:Holliday junction resolvase RusA-like endonuclease